MSSACLAHAGNQAHEPRRRETLARARAQAPTRYARNRVRAGLEDWSAEGMKHQEGKAAARTEHDKT